MSEEELDGDLDALARALAEMRTRVAPLVLARQERRREGATPAERLSTPQHITLLALADGPLTITALAAATGVAVSTATRMAQGLAREGWVERAVAVPGGDRRCRHVALTVAGRAVCREAGEATVRRCRSLLAHLDAPQRAAIMAGMSALMAAVEADAERGAPAER